MILRRPHEFKIACLEDIRALFPPEWNPFYAGFGNRDTDTVSYKEVGVPPARTFIINPKGQISKGSSAVQSSTWSSLSAINQLVDEVFPAVPVRL
jgi:phosphatidate phosphatase LPIN